MKDISIFKTASLKDAVLAGLVTAFSPIRENVNGYKFITFLNGQSATNVYLGRKSADKMEEGDSLTKELASQAMIVLSTNAEGELRVKLSLSGESSYIGADALFDDVPASGVVSSKYVEEVLDHLSKEFSTLEEEAPKSGRTF